MYKLILIILLLNYNNKCKIILKKSNKMTIKVNSYDFEIIIQTIIFLVPIIENFFSK